MHMIRMALYGAFLWRECNVLLVAGPTITQCVHMTIITDLSSLLQDEIRSLDNITVVEHALQMFHNESSFSMYIGLNESNIIQLSRH